MDAAQRPHTKTNEERHPMASMTTRAAVLHRPGTDWEITELDLDPPKEYEVLIRYKAAGLCHSDEHIRREGGSHIRFPLVGGRAGETRAGETVVVMGVGGVGINAVQGARYAGATRMVAIDPTRSSSRRPSAWARRTRSPTPTRRVRRSSTSRAARWRT
jgi:Zn-dependent alcohol dehydrogenase